MTETQRTPEGMSSKPRIKPADAEDGRPVSISARLGRLQFHYSGKFRVLQIADIQDGPKVSKDTITLIEASLDATRPDLVIFSGNQIAGYDPAFADSFRKRRWCDEPIAESALNHTRALVRKAIGQFTEPLAARGIPWAVTYGNHDFQCGLSNAELDGIYREFPGCVNPPSETLPNQIAYTCGAGGAVQTPSGATGSGAGITAKADTLASLTMLVPMLLCLLLCLPPHPQWVPVNQAPSRCRLWTLTIRAMCWVWSFLTPAITCMAAASAHHRPQRSPS